jgi:hypothetical protein
VDITILMERARAGHGIVAMTLPETRDLIGKIAAFVHATIVAIDEAGCEEEVREDTALQTAMNALGGREFIASTNR